MAGKRKHGDDDAAAPVTEEPRVRSVEKLYVHADTLACAMKHLCRPCCYKIVLHSRPGLLPNHRPEMCPRMKPAPAAEEATLDSSQQPVEDRKKAAIGLYDAAQVQRLLTVGDGNFSFSLALARAFQGSTVTLVVTSHESRESVVDTYPDGKAILEELADLPHVQVLHGVDATNAEQMRGLGAFDRILWNFPCVRVPQGKDGQNEEMDMNKTLLREFFAHVGGMLLPQGQVHVTHKTKPPYSQWGIENLAIESGLTHKQSVIFDRCLYPGYSNKKVLSKGSFPIWDSQTFVFTAPTTEKTDQEAAEAASPGMEVEQGDVVPMTTELLEQVYLRLRPSIAQKMEHEANLLKLQLKQKQTGAEIGQPASQQQRQKLKNKQRQKETGRNRKQHQSDQPTPKQRAHSKIHKHKHPRHKK